LVARKTAPSVEPVVENAQHEPHWPWSLTGVTAPAAFQSTDAGSAALGVWRSVRFTFFDTFSCAR
jgi:hypothetical protein